MTKGILSFMIIGLFLLTFSFVNAQPPFTQPVTGTPGYNILSIEAPFTHTFNTSYTLHIHITNNTNGKLINSSVTCFYHLATFNGTEISEGFINNQDGYLNTSYTKTLEASNFTNLGFHNILIECVDSSGVVGSPARVTIDVTYGGEARPNDNLVIGFGLLILLILSLSVLIIVQMMGHIINKDYDLLDLAKSWGLYFALLGALQLAQIYLNNLIIIDWLNLFVTIYGVPMMIVPIIALLLSIFSAKKQAKEEANKW